MPPALKRYRRLIAGALVVTVTAGFVVFVLPQLTGLSETLRRLRDADPAWIGLAIALEVLSLGGYAALFRAVFSCHDLRIGWNESSQITLAGTVASKLLATGGAGGVALTVWALRASGLNGRSIARRMLAFELLMYAVFAGALLLVGAGLRTGVLTGVAPWTLTVVPAVIAGGAIAVTLGLRALPAGQEHRIAARAEDSRRGRRLLSHIAAAPRMLREATGVASGLLRDRELGIAGAIGYWAADFGPKPTAR